MSGWSSGEIIAELQEMEARLQGSGIYPVRDAVDLAMTCMQTMMDANLALQIRTAQAAAEGGTGLLEPWARPPCERSVMRPRGASNTGAD